MENVKTSLVVRLVAKPGKETALAEFLSGALPLAQAETFTPVWFALRASADVFYIVDAFANAEDRAKHLAGDIAAALMANAETLLAEAPSITEADVLAVKLPA